MMVKNFFFYILFLSIKQEQGEQEMIATCLWGILAEGGEMHLQSQSRVLVTTDFVFVCKLRPQELVIFVGFRRQPSAAPTASKLPLPPSLPFFSLCFWCVATC